MLTSRCLWGMQFGNTVPAKNHGLWSAKVLAAYKLYKRHKARGEKVIIVSESLVMYVLSSRRHDEISS